MVNEKQNRVPENIVNHIRYIKIVINMQMIRQKCYNLTHNKYKMSIDYILFYPTNLIALQLWRLYIPTWHKISKIFETNITRPSKII